MSRSFRINPYSPKFDLLTIEVRTHGIISHDFKHLNATFSFKCLSSKHHREAGCKFDKVIVIAYSSLFDVSIVILLPC